MRENANLNTTIKSNKVQCNMCFSVINIFRPGICKFLAKYCLDSDLRYIVCACRFKLGLTAGFYVKLNSYSTWGKNCCGKRRRTSSLVVKV